MSAIATDRQEPRFPVIREAVAAFAGKTELRDAVTRLLASGFKPADLSVLATHDSLEVAGRGGGSHCPRRANGTFEVPSAAHRALTPPCAWRASPPCQGPRPRPRRAVPSRGR